MQLLLIGNMEMLKFIMLIVWIVHVVDSCRYFKETEGKSKGCITSIAGNVNGAATMLIVKTFMKTDVEMEQLLWAITH